MNSAQSFQHLENILDYAGVRLNGQNPWDILVKNRKFPTRVLGGGSLAMGESYLDGWWECKAIDQMITRILKAELDKKARDSFSMLWTVLKSRMINLQTTAKAFINGKKHYDLGYDLFSHMLDKRMIYSCGYWKDAQTLDEAQEAKLELIAAKLYLQPGMTVLDIGCGWGGLAKYLARNHHVKVTGITVSDDQTLRARETCKGLDVTIKQQDYRNVDEQYDRIVSVGMFEHVGHKNYPDYFKTVRRCLKPDGLHLLHTIGSNESYGVGMDPWLDKYIFPNASLPTADLITKAIDHLFKIEDWHNFGHYYDKTLMAWHSNFNRHWEQLRQTYDERFFRMWNYYLLLCAATFRSGVNGLWQIVLSHKDSALCYESIR